MMSQSSNIKAAGELIIAAEPHKCNEVGSMYGLTICIVSIWRIYSIMPTITYLLTAGDLILHVGMGICQYSPVELEMYCDIPFPNVHHPPYYSDTAQTINHPFPEL